MRRIDVSLLYEYVVLRMKAICRILSSSYDYVFDGISGLAIKNA